MVPMPPVLPMSPSQPHRWHSLRPWSRHSLVLMISGMAYVLTGLSYILSEATSSRTEALQIALIWAPFEVWGLVFILTGLAAILSSRWPPASETWGYTMMTGLSVAWGLFYLTGVFFGSPLVNLSGFLVWSLLGFVWWAVSGLRNPAPTIVYVPVTEEELARIQRVASNGELRS